jgi:hypothetical protein
MTCSFDNFLDQRLLLQEIGLQLQKALAAAHNGARFTFSFAFPTQLANIKAVLGKDVFHSPWLVRILCMVYREYHRLRDLAAVRHIHATS